MGNERVPCCEAEFWAYLALSFIIVSFAGIASGLALGLLSFSQVDLEVLIKAGQPKEQKYAAEILPIVKNQHFVLCTLLVVKSLAMEALPIFLDMILPNWAAILASVIFVIAFAEIIPQAVCARHGLSLGAFLSPLVQLLLLLFYPIAYPISKLLDWLLGKGHSALYRRAELKTLVDLHADEAGKGGELSQHETAIISGALDLTQKSVKDAMTPISEVFCLDINSKLDMDTMDLIMNKGHSRIPIYSGNPNNIMGIILVKNLIFCRPEDETPIKNITIRKIPMVHEDWPLYNILSQFKKGHSHMAIVVKSKSNVKITVDNGEVKPTVLNTDPDSNPKPTQANMKDNNVIEEDKELHPQGESWDQSVENISYLDLKSLPSNVDEEITGIITLEDVMEEVLQEEILDETDEYIAVHNKIRINLPHSSSGSRRHRKIPQPFPLS